MKLLIDIGGTQLLLTPAQIERLHKLLSGCEVMETTYRGNNNGFYGRNQEYDISFMPFDAATHTQGVKIVPDEALDKYRVLIAMRNNKTEI
jgi:hypothetical protein